MHKIVVFFTFLAVLLLLNFNIYQREIHLKEGVSIFLKLAPVDPRSLMQGDYMALHFEVSESIPKNLTKDRGVYDGFILVDLDVNNVASFVSIYNNETLKENQTLLQYRVRAGEVKFATNAFFFEEGSAKRYEKAKFGEFKVNDKHELLLIHLYDKDLTKI